MNIYVFETKPQRANITENIILSPIPSFGSKIGSVQHLRANMFKQYECLTQEKKTNDFYG